MILTGCAAAAPATRAAPFRGVETESWLVAEVARIDRNDLLPAFEASARSHGCITEKLGYETSRNIAGERRSYNGINASCEEGVIALITLIDGRVRVGCEKPTTLQDCDLLLRKISQAR